MIKNIINLFARTSISLIFLLSGFNKITNYEDTINWMEKYGVTGDLLAPAIFFEILAPLFLIFGYQTKIAAILLAIFCVITAVIFHNDFTNQMQMIAFLKNTAIAGGLIFVSLYGPGEISVDKKLK